MSEQCIREVCIYRDYYCVRYTTIRTPSDNRCGAYLQKADTTRKFTCVLVNLNCLHVMHVYGLTSSISQYVLSEEIISDVRMVHTGYMTAIISVSGIELHELLFGKAKLPKCNACTSGYFL